MHILKTTTMCPVKLKRQMMRQKRKELRTAELIRQDNENNNQMQVTAFELSKSSVTGETGKYNIWRRDYGSPNSDSTLKLLRDQMILAKAYSQIAKSKNESSLYNSLIKQCRESQRAIGEANSDAELHPSALSRAKQMGHVLFIAQNRLYDCPQLKENFKPWCSQLKNLLTALMKKSSFLIQVAAKIVPRPLHCLSMQLVSDYFLPGMSK